MPPRAAHKFLLITTRTNQVAENITHNHSRQGIMVHKLPEPEGADQCQLTFLTFLNWITVKYIFLQHLASVRESLPDRTDDFDDHNSSDSDDNPKEKTQRGRGGGRGRRGRGATTAGRGRGRGAGEKGKSTRGTSRKKTSGGMAEEL